MPPAVVPEKRSSNPKPDAGKKSANDERPTRKKNSHTQCVYLKFLFYFAKLLLGIVHYTC